MKNILLLTATITPPAGARDLSRADPSQRLDDYVRALGVYAGLAADGVVDRIVFAENSESDLDPLRECVRDRGVEDRVEFHSEYGLDYPPEYGRGYGEFRLVDRAMGSPAMHGVEPDDRIWKVTGRYVFRNIRSLIGDPPDRFDLYCNCRDRPMRITDQHLQAWRYGVYEPRLSGLYRHLKESETGQMSEQSMRQLIDDGYFDGLDVVPRFRHTPVIDGYRGWDGKNYSAGASNQAKLLLRRVALKVAPNWWI